MQKLGIGLSGLDVILGFLGIAPSHGSDAKWERLMDRLGLAENEIAAQVLEKT